MRVLGMYQMQKLLLSCFLFSLLNPLFADERKDLFMKRSYHDAKTVEEAKEIKKDINVDPTARMDIFSSDTNLSKLNLSPDTFKRTDPEEIKSASAINAQAKSTTFKKQLKNMEDNVLHDKALDWSKSLPSSGVLAQEQRGNLAHDERLFVVISSSMPETLVKTYLSHLEPIAKDVTFVMRGGIGGVKKIKPTLEWIKRVKMYDSEHSYQCQVDINPNITRRYGITKVPALVFVSGYDESMMGQHTGTEGETALKEKVSIVYGAIDPVAAMQEIEKKTQNPNLQNLIDKLF